MITMEYLYQGVFLLSIIASFLLLSTLYLLLELPKLRKENEYLKLENEKLNTLVSLDCKRFLVNKRDYNERLIYLVRCMINYRHRRLK
jgi:cell division protein FtsB